MEKYGHELADTSVGKNEPQWNAENLEKHLDYMSSQVAAEATDAEMEDALQEALTEARPERNWHPRHPCSSALIGGG